MSTTILALKNDYADLDPVAAAELNARADALEAVFASRLVKSVAGGVEVTLTDEEAVALVLELSGLLTASINVVLPLWAGRRWVIRNDTTGAFEVTVKTPAGSGIVVTQGYRAEVFCDGTDVVRAAPDVSNAAALVIGGGTPIAKYLSATKVWDPPSIADGAITSTTVTVTGAAVGDLAVAGLTTLTAGLALLSAHVTAADTVTVVLLNKTGGALDVASGTLRVGVWKH
ncbi:MAG: hypothetical protein ACK47B_11030 [Armatimonadota bacterium]